MITKELEFSVVDYWLYLLFSHPLLPLLTLLFEKCEQATQTSSCPSSESLDDDIQKFVRQQEQEGKPFFSEDPELDGLVYDLSDLLHSV